MPLYDYICQDCGLEFEGFQSVNQRNNQNCPDCGKLATKLVTTQVGAAIDSSMKDLAGNPVWFPKDGKPYFDKGMQRTFNTKKEKLDFMNKKRLVMDGSSNPKNWPVEAGDMRSRAYRRENKLED